MTLSTQMKIETVGKVYHVVGKEDRHYKEVNFTQYNHNKNNRIFY